MTKLYNFIEIFKEPVISENGESINIKKIEIPLIQRDYAQGRVDSDTNRVRKRFLDALYDALTTKPITLDFVYGDIELDGKMIPLDGQQRLTTLFLLHWYAAKKENILFDEYEFLKHFSYEVRYSARDFCSYLIDFNPKFDKKNISDEIINQQWFPYDWLKDQTIKSMLVMLDSINERFNSLADIWERLKNDSITFYFLPIKEMGLTDELYIKMNSRGKPLTMFENFKAELEREIKTYNKEVGDRISSKIDKDWTDLLWNFKDSQNLTDDSFLHYFRFICDVICYKNDDTPYGKEFDEIELIKEYFDSHNPNIEFNINILESYFDCWTEVSRFNKIDNFFNNLISKEHETNKIKIENRYDINIFADCLKNYGLYLENRNARQFPLGRFILLYAIIDYLLNKNIIDDDQFRRRLRIINNLIYNSEYEMSNSTSRTGGNRMPAILKQVDSIMINGIISEEIDLGFNSKQLQEERAKLKWTSENENLAESLYKLEDNEYLYGQIGIIGLENYNLFDRFNELFSCKLDLVDCALMSIGNYGQTDKWRFQLGTKNPESKKAWTRLFHSGSFGNFEETKRILIELLSKSEHITEDVLQKVIDDFLNECETKNLYPWRYYYVKYDAFRPGKFGKYYWNNQAAEPYVFSVMATELHVSQNAYMPFLKAIDKGNQLDKDDFGRSIVRDDCRIISKNNSYIYFKNNSDEILKVVNINQQNGIDTEDRIKKILLI